MKYKVSGVSYCQEEMTAGQFEKVSAIIAVLPVEAIKDGSFQIGDIVTPLSEKKLITRFLVAVVTADGKEITQEQASEFPLTVATKVIKDFFSLNKGFFEILQGFFGK